MHTRRRSAFTLVEIAVAVAVTIVLAGVAIPRYNSLIRTQDFYSQAQEIVSCFQRAQSLAGGAQGATLSTGNPIRWTAAQLTRSGNTVTCTVVAFEDQVGVNDLTTFTTTTPTSTLTSGTNTYTTTDLMVTGLNDLSSRRIYFGVLEKGLPVADTTLSVQPRLGLGSSV